MEQLFPTFSNYILAKALSINISFYQIIFIISTTLFLSRIPISPSAIGVQEGILVGLFTLLGFTKEEGFAFSLTTRLLSMFFSLPIPLIYFSDLFKLVKQAKSNKVLL